MDQTEFNRLTSELDILSLSISNIFASILSQSGGVTMMTVVFLPPPDMEFLANEEADIDEECNKFHTSKSIWQQQFGRKPSKTITQGLQERILISNWAVANLVAREVRISPVLLEDEGWAKIRFYRKMLNIYFTFQYRLLGCITGI